ncbi:g3044 [Coccomyxa elongata]
MDAICEPDPIHGVPFDAPWGRLGRDLTLALVSIGSKFVLNVLNTTRFTNVERIEKAATERPPGTGLLTVCNHTSTIDDPVVLSALLPWKFFYTESMHGGNRWSLCAKEICYRNAFLGQFFLSGKTLPIERGQGLQQPAMLTAARLLARGDWVHVFPEGRVGYSGRLQPCKWGVGKLVCDCVAASGRCPVVLPFYHSGMGRVMPEHGRIPRVGRQVDITVGEPMDVSDLACRCGQPGVDQKQVWKDITERICHGLQELEETSPPNANQLKEKNVSQGSIEADLKKRDPVLPER